MEDESYTSAQVSIEVKRSEGAIYRYYLKEAGNNYGEAFYIGTEKTQTITDLNLNEKSYYIKVEASNEYGATYKESKIELQLNDGLLQKIAEIEDMGVQTISLTAKNTEGTIDKVTYSLNVLIHEGDLTLDGVTPITINDITYSPTSAKAYLFGSASDIAASTTNAQNTIVLKVKGNLVIEEGTTLSTVNNSYGGPKGLIIYCTETLTNKGTISMSGRGAKAAGQNVYLWKNEDNSYEYIPAQGGNGGTSVQGGTPYSGKVGNSGKSGLYRSTGGGGSGASVGGYNTCGYSGAGAAGTSYSGGSGGAGRSGDQVYNTTNYADSGKPNGGAGGVAKMYAYDGYGATHGIGGGAGNPGGTSAEKITSNGSNGTGGLIVIYANNFSNENLITANGMGGGSAYRAGGGGSGGGSINIFYNKNILNSFGTLQANGGAAGKGTRSGESANGGAGGTGSITIGNISTGTFINEKN